MDHSLLRALRNSIERAAALAGLMVALPVLAVAAVAIKLEDGGPPLFRQTRVGRGGHLFGCVKLRTMSRGAAGPSITRGGDARITRIGRWLRRYKIDELPQLWNVVRGDMALVGPRPEAPEFVDLSHPAWREVLLVRPGITDLATLAFRDEEALLQASDDPVAAYRNAVLPGKLALSVSGLRARGLRFDTALLCCSVLTSFLPARFPGDRLAMALQRRFPC